MAIFYTKCHLDSRVIRYNLAVSADRRERPRQALAHYRDALELAALLPPAFDAGAVRERIAALEGRVEVRP